MAKKSTGRPVGARTQDRLVADESVAICPHCGSRDRGEFRSLRRVEGSGEINGRRYEGVELRNCNCNSCGGAMVVRRYLWVP
jgi:hypothetical protein